jgi:beta-xylosidase
MGKAFRMATTSKTEPDPTLMELHAIERDLSTKLMEARHQAEEDWQAALAADAARREALAAEVKQLQRTVLAEEVGCFEQELSALREKQVRQLARERELLAGRKAAWAEQLLALILATSTGEGE